MKTRKRILSVVVLCGAAFAAVALATQASRPAAGGFTPYTITWQMTEYYSDGRVVQTYRETRSTYPDGGWRSVIHLPDGKAVERVAGPAHSAPAAGGGPASFRTPTPARLRGDARSHKNYLRSGRVQQQEVDVLRYTLDGKIHEVYHARRLNNDIIKTVTSEEKVIRVLEPVSIVVGRPDR